MRPNKALVWLLLGFFLVGEANSAPFGRLRARLRSREQQRANPPAPAAGTPQASAQASSIGGGGITGGGGTPAGGGGASSVGALTDIDNADTATDGQVLTAGPRAERRRRLITSRTPEMQLRKALPRIALLAAVRLTSSARRT
jgi:hypothetical protein